jgi:hypothetical protein
LERVGSSIKNLPLYAQILELFWRVLGLRATGLDEKAKIGRLEVIKQDSAES